MQTWKKMFYHAAVTAQPQTCPPWWRWPPCHWHCWLSSVVHLGFSCPPLPRPVSASSSPDKILAVRARELWAGGDYGPGSWSWWPSCRSHHCGGLCKVWRLHHCCACCPPCCCLLSDCRGPPAPPRPPRWPSGSGSRPASLRSRSWCSGSGISYRHRTVPPEHKQLGDGGMNPPVKLTGG